ncbi:MAG: hypothetical protein GX781_04600 [Clostridiales bacterium]|nr:hypothetical protein [Clostridiales bacterium]
MSAETYELVSQGFRYWFVFLGLAIVIRSYRWAMKDHLSVRRTMKALPDSGLIGELVNLATGESLPLPREGIMGSSKTSDVHLSGIRKNELEFVFVDGKGVYITPIHKHHQILLHNQPIGKTGYAQHGTRLNLPGYSLRFRLFAGLDLPQSTYSEELLKQEILSAEDDFDIETLGDMGMPFEPYTDVGLMADSTFITELPQPYIQLNDKQNFENHADISWDPQLTWQYAPPIPETNYSSSINSQNMSGQPVWESSDYENQISDSPARKRSSKRHEK